MSPTQKVFNEPHQNPWIWILISTNQSRNQSINQSIDEFTNQSINQSINLAILWELFGGSLEVPHEEQRVPAISSWCKCQNSDKRMLTTFRACWVPATNLLYLLGILLTLAFSSLGLFSMRRIWGGSWGVTFLLALPTKARILCL
jgi:hypothetical protein